MANRRLEALGLLPERPPPKQGIPFDKWLETRPAKPYTLPIAELSEDRKEARRKQQRTYWRLNSRRINARRRNKRWHQKQLTQEGSNGDRKGNPNSTAIQG